MKKEIIIELGILDKIRSITGKVYNPFRDATGRFASAASSKITDMDLLNRIKNGVGNIKNKMSSLINSDNIGDFTKDEIDLINKKARNIVSGIENSIEGITSDTPITTFFTDKAWKKEIGLDNIATKLLGIEIAKNFLAAAKPKGVILSPTISTLLSDRKFDNSMLPDSIREGLINYDISDPKKREEFVSRILSHELLHARNRDNNTSLFDYVINKKIGDIDGNKYDMGEEEGHTELLSQIYTYKNSNRSTDDFINDNDGFYKANVDRAILRAKNMFPDSPKKALEYINNVHKKGFDRNINLDDINYTDLILGSMKKRREWLINGLDKEDIKLENNYRYKLETIYINPLEEIINYIRDNDYTSLYNKLSADNEFKQVFLLILIRLPNPNNILNKLKDIENKLK